MHERLNKTLIGSVVFIDIIEYSRKPVAEQIECKAQLNRLIGDAVENIAERDRLIVDTGDGVAITLLGAPEDALRIAVGIRERIAGAGLAPESLPFHVRTGINLGPVQVVKDINGQFNVIGDGINVAHRVMGFAAPDQILVSRSYYEVASRLSRELEEMLAYSGLKQDKHVREHEIYQVRSPEIAGSGTAARDWRKSAARWWLWLAAVPLAVAALSGAMNFGDSPGSNAQEPAPPAAAAAREVAVEREGGMPAQSAPAEPERPAAVKSAVKRNEHRESFSCTAAQRSLNQCR